MDEVKNLAKQQHYQSHSKNKKLHPFGFPDTMASSRRPRLSLFSQPLSPSKVSLKLTVRMVRITKENQTSLLMS